MRVGALGARTTAFKTVRVDEVALQRRGITVETLDLSDVFARVRKVSADSAAFKDKAAKLHAYASFGAVPAGPMDNLVRLGVVLDEIVDEFQLDAYAIRCWRELQNELNISPCVLLGELSDRGVAGACEVDIANAVDDARVRAGLRRRGHAAGLEQQLRGGGRQVHPLPLRPDPRTR